jgi:hypothetical protein
MLRYFFSSSFFLGFFFLLCVILPGCTQKSEPEWFDYYLKHETAVFEKDKAHCIDLTSTSQCRAIGQIEKLRYDNREIGHVRKSFSAILFIPGSSGFTDLCEENSCAPYVEAWAKAEDEKIRNEVEKLKTNESAVEVVIHACENPGPSDNKPIDQTRRCVLAQWARDAFYE